MFPVFRSFQIHWSGRQGGGAGHRNARRCAGGQAPHQWTPRGRKVPGGSGDFAARGGADVMMAVRVVIMIHLT